jgi:outer membrane protein
MKPASRAAMFVLLISTIIAPLVRAEDTLSLQKARELTLARSPSLRKAELAVDAAALTRQAQGYSALPSLTATAGASLGYGSGISSLSQSASESAKLATDATIYDGGKNAALVKKYELATEAERQALRSERITLVGSADSAYFSVLEAQASVEAAASDLEAARLRLKLAEAKASAGALSKSDYLQTEAETAGYETTLTKAKKTLSSAKAKLASLTGLPAATTLTGMDLSSYEALITKLNARDEAGIDALVAAVTTLAKANSPSLASYDLASGEARQALAAAKAAFLPSVQAGFSQSFSYGDSALTQTGSLSLTASLSLDFWNTRNAVQSASVAAAQADLDGNAGLTSLELDVSQAVYEWLSSARSLGSSAKALEYAQSNYANVLEKFKLSSATASDLSTAEALVSADKTALITARYDFLSNLSTLRGLAGFEDEAELLKALP